MNAHDIIPHMVRESGHSVRTITTMTGRKSPGAFSGVLYGTRSPGLDTMAEITNACDFDLLVRSRKTGEEIIIDPPERQ